MPPVEETNEELQHGHGAGVLTTDVPREGEQLNVDAPMSCRPIGGVS